MKAEQMDIDDQIYDEEQKQKQLIEKMKGKICQYEKIGSGSDRRKY